VFSIEISPAIVILLVTLAMVLVSKALQNKFLDKEKMKRQKERMKEKQKKMKELTKAGDNEKAQMIQKEIMEDTMEMMKGTQKMMVVSLPLIIVYFILGFLYVEPFESLFPLPTFVWYFGIIPLPDFFVWTIVTGWRRAYFIYYFIWFIIVGIILKVYEKSKGL
jgi:uncharacterized membrane protein (DUF106 family)